MFALKGSFGFDFIILIGQFDVHSLLLLHAKKIYQEFDNNVCVLK